MLYVDMKDFSIFELLEHKNECSIAFSSMGDWTQAFKGTVAATITDTDEDLVHTISIQDRDDIKLDAAEVVSLYFLLDYMYKHSKLDCATGLDKLEFNKFNKLT